MEYTYKTQDRETGTMIDLFYTKEYAEMAVAEYEKQDKADGTYTPNFYEVKELEVGEYYRFILARKIAQLRKEQGMNQTKLAEAVGTNQFHISKIESGAVSPSVDLLARIAKTLGKRIDLVD